MKTEKLTGAFWQPRCGLHHFCQPQPFLSQTFLFARLNTLTFPANKLCCCPGPFGTKTFMGKNLAFRPHTNFAPAQVFQKLGFTMQVFEDEKQLSQKLAFRKQVFQNGCCFAMKTVFLESCVGSPKVVFDATVSKTCFSNKQAFNPRFFCKVSCGKSGTCRNWQDWTFVVLLLAWEPFVFRSPFEKNPMNRNRPFECQMKGFSIGNPFSNWEPFQKRFLNCVLRHQFSPADLGTDFQEPICSWSHFPQRVPDCGPFCGLICFAVLLCNRPQFENPFRKSHEPPV